MYDLIVVALGLSLNGMCCSVNHIKTKAYIPPERKIPGVGGNTPDARFLRYPTQNIPTCWYILALPPMPIPDASQWNIGGVGLSGIGAGVGHVHFMLFMSISFASGTQRKLVFQWNMGLRGGGPLLMSRLD